MSRGHGSVLWFLLLVTVSFSGCGGEDDPVTPPIGTGTISINTEPDSLEASWQLSGPDSFSQSGTADQDLTGLAPGQYSLTWDTVAGWISPQGSTRNLAADSTVTFSGIFLPDPEPVEGYVLIPPVSLSMPTAFTMGSSIEINETPHQVTLTRRFFMAANEVTNSQYTVAIQWAYDQGHVTASETTAADNLDGSTEELLDLDDPQCQISFTAGIFSTMHPDHPVVEVSWYGAVAYCDWLSMQAGIPRAYDHGTWICNSGDPYSASGYRLPTEAEWEFACRAGSTTIFNTGGCLDAGFEANYRGSSPYSDCPAGPYLAGATEVGSYLANQWGLNDMHGNVYEWCNDWHGFYGGDGTNPPGPGTGIYRVMRGGSWFNVGSDCRSATRGSDGPNGTHDGYGIRPVMTSP